MADEEGNENADSDAEVLRGVSAGRVGWSEEEETEAVGGADNVAGAKGRAEAEEGGGKSDPAADFGGANGAALGLRDADPGA